jgi:hypothetical protein
MNKIDVFIVNYFCAHDTAHAIGHLGHDDHWRFWVIDNSHDDAQWTLLQSALAKLPIAIELIRAPSNLGFGNACNTLFAKSQGDYCLLLNPDAQISAADLKALSRSLDAAPSFAALAPLMRWQDSDEWRIPTMTPQTSIHQIGQAIANWHPRLLLAAWQRYYQAQRSVVAAQSIVTQAFLSGAILLIRRSAIHQISPKDRSLFDARFFMFFEDADLSRRLRLGGFQLGIAPSAQAAHLYQHKLHKNQLMQDSYAQYEALHQAWFRRFKPAWMFFDKLVRRFSSTHTPANVASSLAQLNQALGNRRLVAWSPSPTVMPAIWRNLTAQSGPSFTSHSWDALIPGQYYGVAIDQDSTLTWIGFERV